MRQRLQPRIAVASASPVPSARFVARVTVEAKPTGNEMSGSLSASYGSQGRLVPVFVPAWIPASSRSGRKRRGKRPGGSASRHLER